MGKEIPEQARVLFLQDEKFKIYYNQLTYIVRDYERIMGMVRLNARKLLRAHIEDLENKIAPGLTILTWTSMNIDGYIYRL